LHGLLSRSRRTVGGCARRPVDGQLLVDPVSNRGTVVEWLDGCSLAHLLDELDKSLARKPLGREDLHVAHELPATTSIPCGSSSSAPESIRVPQAGTGRRTRPSLGVRVPSSGFWLTTGARAPSRVAGCPAL
jgi:hypothetical protein